MDPNSKIIGYFWNHNPKLSKNKSDWEPLFKTKAAIRQLTDSGLLYNKWFFKLLLSRNP
jgi:hypothetical protein